MANPNQVRKRATSPVAGSDAAILQPLVKRALAQEKEAGFVMTRPSAQMPAESPRAQYCPRTFSRIKDFFLRQVERLTTFGTAARTDMHVRHAVADLSRQLHSSFAVTSAMPGGKKLNMLEGELKSIRNALLFWEGKSGGDPIVSDIIHHVLNEINSEEKRNFLDNFSVAETMYPRAAPKLFFKELKNAVDHCMLGELESDLVSFSESQK